MGQYAANTKVRTDQSLSEIERTLDRFGADCFGFKKSEGQIQIEFVKESRSIMIRIALPDRQSRDFTRTPERGNLRSEEAAQKEWAQACRQRYRSLACYVKALLVSIEDEIVTFEEAFMPHIVLPDGSTVGQRALPQIASMYEVGSNAQTRLALDAPDEDVIIDAE